MTQVDKDDIKLSFFMILNERNKSKLPYPGPPYMYPLVDLRAWGLGGKGGGFEPEFLEASISLGFI